MGRMTERRYMLFVVTLVWSIAISHIKVFSQDCVISWVPTFCDRINANGINTTSCASDDQTIAETCGNISDGIPLNLSVCYMQFIPLFCRDKVNGTCTTADEVPCKSFQNLPITEETCGSLEDVCRRVSTYNSSIVCGNQCVQNIGRFCEKLKIPCNFSTAELTTEPLTSSSTTLRLNTETSETSTKESTVETTRHATSSASRGFALSPTILTIIGAAIGALAVITVTTVLLVRRHCRNKRDSHRSTQVTSPNNTDANNSAADLDRVIPPGATLETLDGGYSEIDNIRASMEAGQYNIILEPFANTPDSLERHYEQITPQTDGYHTYVTFKTSNASQQYAHLGVISSDEHAYTSLNNDNAACIKTDPESCITESNNVEETRSPYFVLEKQDKFKQTTEAVHIASGTADDTQDKKHLYFTLESLDKKQNGHANTNTTSNDAKQNNVYHTLEKEDVCLNADACKGQNTVSEATGSRPCTSDMHINVAENVETHDVK